MFFTTSQILLYVTRIYSKAKQNIKIQVKLKWKTKLKHSNLN